MSAASKSKLIIFGANGQLGQAIVTAVTSQHNSDSKHFEVTAVIRKDTLEYTEEKKAAGVEKLRASGAKIVRCDFDPASVEEIAKLIRGHEIVLSAIASYGPGPQPDLKLLEAVKLAKVSWFIPSAYGVDCAEAYSESVAAIATKRDVIQAVRSCSNEINSIFINNGAFLEYAVSPFLGVDVAGACLTAPYSFDNRFSATKIDDVAVLVGELLLHRNEAHVKNQTVFLAGDTLSFSEFHHLLEEKYKKEFKKIVISKEEAIEVVKNDTKVEKFIERFRVVLGEQKGVYWNDSWNSKYAKHIKVTTVKEYLAQLP